MESCLWTTNQNQSRHQLGQKGQSQSQWRPEKDQGGHPRLMPEGCLNRHSIVVNKPSITSPRHLVFGGNPRHQVTFQYSKNWIVSSTLWRPREQVNNDVDCLKPLCSEKFSRWSQMQSLVQNAVSSLNIFGTRGAVTAMYLQFFRSYSIFTHKQTAVSRFITE